MKRLLAFVLSMYVTCAQEPVIPVSIKENPRCAEQYVVMRNAQGEDTSHIVLPSRCAESEKLEYLVSLDTFKPHPEFAFHSYGSSDSDVTSTDRVVTLPWQTVVRAGRFFNGELLR